MEIKTRVIDITPVIKCPLGGGYRPNDNYKSVHANLEANIVLIRQSGKYYLLINLDLLFVGQYLSHSIIEVARKYLPIECIWISATHNHNAPATDLLRPSLGVANQEYLHTIIKVITLGIEEIFVDDDFQEVIVQQRSTQGFHTVNRRKKRLIRLTRQGIEINKVFMAQNNEGVRDESIDRLDFLDSSGNTVAVIWNYACHPVSYHSSDSVTSGFPGRVRDQLRELVGEIPVIFLNGFAGTVRPPSVARFANGPVKRLRLGQYFGLFSPQEYEDWVTSLSRRVLNAPVVSIIPSNCEIDGVRFEVETSDFIEDSPSKLCTFQGMKLGKIILAGVSAEPSTEFSRLVRGLSIDYYIVPCGYLEDVFGYLPTSEQLKEGGYEAEGFLKYFGGKAIIYGSQDLFLQCFKRIINELSGRNREMT